MSNVAKFPTPQSFDDEIEMVKERKRYARDRFDLLKRELAEHQVYKAAVGRRLSEENRKTLEEQIEFLDERVVQAACDISLYDQISEELIKASGAKDEER